jgi:serine phosphatase RsbU (regulator of sigma subunit)
VAGMARLRGALAGLAITGAPPDRLLGWLNDLVWHVSPEHTASVIAGYFEPARRLLTWAQAGHPPPVLVRGAWALPVESPAGVLLGAGKGIYEVSSLWLQPGDLLLLYSDGLVERRNRSVDEGVARLVGAVRGTDDPERLVAVALDALGPTHTDDDTCLVALAVQ